MPQTSNYSRIRDLPASVPSSPSRVSSDSFSSSTDSVDDFDPLRRPRYRTQDSESDDSADDNGEKENGGGSLRLHKRRGSRKFKAYHHRRQSSLQAASNVSRRLGKRFNRWATPPKICAIFSLVLLVTLVGVFGGMSRKWVPAKLRTSLKIHGQSPPWYPSPLGGTMLRWRESYVKASDLVKKMSLVEKVNVTTGTGWAMGMCVGNTGPAMDVGFPSLCLQDGPLGLRFADNITATPAGITVGATWNKDLMYKRGKMLGLESRKKGVNVLLGPSVGPLGRIPLGGRNWEAFGSDPVLQGTAAAHTIRGIQEEGVMATIKHFVANEQEHFRQAWEWGLPDPMSSNLEDRTLHEIYAWPFADAIRAGVASVMCSYNMVNNSQACQNSKLINGILKDEMGFQGFVQSDWLAQRSGVASALSGLDMSMPGDGEHWADGLPFWGPHLTRAVLNGTLPVDRLNDMATRIVAAWYQVGQDNETYWPPSSPNGTHAGPNFSSWTNDRFGLLYPGSDSKDTGVVNQWVNAAEAGTYSHSALARRIAAEGTVLLKNAGFMLPLAKSGRPQYEEDIGDYDPKVRRRIAVFGEDSRLDPDGPNVCPDRGCNRGTLASGWGSGAVEFPYLVSPLDALRGAFNKDTVDFTEWPSNDIPSKNNLTMLEEQDICIVFVNADGGEGFVASDDIKGDRNDLYLQKQGEELIYDVASHCGIKTQPENQPEAGKRDPHQSHGNTIIVIHSVGPVLMENFVGAQQVGAVLLANLPGQESGNALVDVLFGFVNPSGHLPYTIPRRLSDYGPTGEILTDPGDFDVPQQNFTEGTLVDYRWFDAHHISPRFEFGYGLSYTRFSMSDLRVFATARPDPGPAPRPADECEPPTYTSKLPDVKEVLFPSGFRRLKKFIYPYLEKASDARPSSKDYPFPQITEISPLSEAGGGEGGNPALWEPLVQIDLAVRNDGERGGQAVVQLYVVFPSDVTEEIEIGNDEEDPADATPTAGSAPTPLTKRASGARRVTVPIRFAPRQLRGFEKIHLRGSYQPPSQTFTAPVQHKHTPHYPVQYSTAVAPGPAPEADRLDQPGSDGKGGIYYETGEDARVHFTLTRRDLSYWSSAKQNWVLPPGPFGVELGFSSRDIRIRGRVF